MSALSVVGRVASARSAAEALGLRVVQVQGQSGFYLVDALFSLCLYPNSFAFPGMGLDGLERELQRQRRTGLTGSPCGPYEPLRHATGDGLASHVLAWLVKTRLSSLCLSDDWQLCALALDVPVEQVEAVFRQCFATTAETSCAGEVEQ